MMKVVLKVEIISDEKTKKKVFRAIAGLFGIASMAADTKENKIIVIGSADPVAIVGKVRKVWPSAKLFSVGPEKEEPKKDESKPETRFQPIDWAKAWTPFHF